MVFSSLSRCLLTIHFAAVMHADAASHTSGACLLVSCYQRTRPDNSYIYDRAYVRRGHQCSVSSRLLMLSGKSNHSRLDCLHQFMLSAQACLSMCGML